MADIRTSSLGGVPRGATADRPSSPSVGDVFYNGTLGCLEIYTVDGWYASSAPMAIPTIGTVTDTSLSLAYSSTAGSVSVAFTQGTGGGLPNTFTATSNPGNITAQSATSPISVTGLTPGTSYTFTVVGTNNFGTSAATAASNSIVPTTKPDTPIIGTATVISSSTNVSLAFTAPTYTGGKSITSYTVTPYIGATAQTAITGISSSPATLTGLTQGSSYTFKIQAVNANGSSPMSSASNSVTVPVVVSIDYLVIAGGGGPGTGGITGGGGAGGYRNSVSGELSGGSSAAETPISLAVGTPITITVGAGGSGMANGANSSIAASGLTTITSIGGGRGGRDGSNNNGQAGGSGGGAYTSTGTYGLGTSGQGNNGGSGVASEDSGGGGGAGAVGGNGTTGFGGAGGNGLSSSITGSAVTRGGGGGGSTFSGTLGPAGTGGGGTGGRYSGSATNGTSGTANTGGGAGGSNANTNGGSGVVILRSLSTAASTTGSPTATTSGSYKIYTFTGSGSITF